MKIDIVQICSYLILLVAIAEAQIYSKLNRPIIDLNARPQVTTTVRPPNERRKLSIFPKNMAKYVITSKPYAKVETFSPYELSTKRPLMQKMLPHAVKTSKMVPTTKPSVNKLTQQSLSDNISKEQVETAYISKKDNSVETNKQSSVLTNNNRGSPRLRKINNQFVSRDVELEAENTDHIFLVNSAEVGDQTNEGTSTKSNGETSVIINELDAENNRPKRLSIFDLGEYHNINAPKRIDIYLLQQKDYDEFIFVNERFKPVDKKESNLLDLEEEPEQTTDAVWLDESPVFRPKRSVNIIEEENLGTTISGYKFTGREPRVDSNMLFKNINA